MEDTIKNNTTSTNFKIKGLSRYKYKEFTIYYLKYLKTAMIYSEAKLILETKDKITFKNWLQAL